MERRDMDVNPQRQREALLRQVEGMNVSDIKTEFCGNLSGNINSI